MERLDRSEVHLLQAGARQLLTRLHTNNCAVLGYRLWGLRAVAALGPSHYSLSLNHLSVGFHQHGGGKHHGRRMSELVVDDPGWCQWILGQAKVPCPHCEHSRGAPVL